MSSHICLCVDVSVISTFFCVWLLYFYWFLCVFGFFSLLHTSTHVHNQMSNGCSHLFRFNMWLLLHIKKNTRQIFHSGMWCADLILYVHILYIIHTHIHRVIALNQTVDTVITDSSLRMRSYAVHIHIRLRFAAKDKPYSYAGGGVYGSHIAFFCLDADAQNLSPETRRELRWKVLSCVRCRRVENHRV